MGSGEVLMLSKGRHQMLTCAHTHCVSKGSTLKALDRNFPLYPPQGERTELITMDTSKQQLFSVCGKGFIGTLVQDLNKYCVLISRCFFFLQHFCLTFAYSGIVNLSRLLLRMSFLLLG